MTLLEWIRMGVTILCLIVSAVLAWTEKRGWGWFLFFALLTSSPGGSHG